MCHRIIQSNKHSFFYRFQRLYPSSWQQHFFGNADRVYNTRCFSTQKSCTNQKKGDRHSLVRMAYRLSFGDNSLYHDTMTFSNLLIINATKISATPTSIRGVKISPSSRMAKIRLNNDSSDNIMEEWVGDVYF